MISFVAQSGSAEDKIFNVQRTEVKKSENGFSDFHMSPLMDIPTLQQRQ